MKPKEEFNIFHTPHDFLFTSFFAQYLDDNSIKAIYFILKTKTNNRKMTFKTSYEEFIEDGKLSGPNYVRKSLQLLQELGLIEVGRDRRNLTIKVLKTSKRVKIA